MRTAIRFLFIFSFMFFVCSCEKKKEPEKPVSTPGNVTPPAETGKNSEATDSETGSFRVKIPIRLSGEETRKTIPEVLVDESNIKITKLEKPFSPPSVEAGRWSRYSPLPHASLASLLTDSASLTRCSWAPKWVHWNAGLVRISDAELTPDSSIFVFVETTGSGNGPYGSRIILLNAHTWEFIKIIDFRQRWIVRADFLPGTRQLLAWCEKQPESDQPFGIARISLDSGKEKQFIPLKAPLTTACLIGNRYFAAERDSCRILVFRTHDLTLPSETIETSAPVSAMIPSSDGKLLLAANASAVELFKLSDLRKLSERPLPSIPCRVDSMIELSDGSLLLAPGSVEKPEAFLISKKLVTPFASGSTGLLTVNADKTLVLAGMRVKGRLGLYALPSLQQQELIEPESLAPRFSGDPRMAWFLPSVNAIAVLDNYGNFYLLYKESGRKKYTKDVIFTNVK